MRRLIAAILTVLFVSGCECAGQHVAYVFDSKTMEPVPGARVSGYKTYNSDEVFIRDEYTDSNGFYDVGFMDGSGTKKCPGFKVYIRKDGYKLHTVSNSRLGDVDTVYLEKE